MEKILIADDMEAMRRSIKNNLKEIGYTDFCEATNGAEAIDMYENEKPALVIMDITMPNMDGIEALSFIMSKYPNAAVIMTGGRGQEAYFISAIRAGAKDFLVKPFAKDKIQKTVSAVLNSLQH